uniref:Uncharacterized protein n=1 Tax=Glossina pallidipes TaxID=7398 RepID=A0A1A9ZK77_GLOPL
MEICYKTLFKISKSMGLTSDNGECFYERPLRILFSFSHNKYLLYKVPESSWKLCNAMPAKNTKEYPHYKRNKQ